MSDFIKILEKIAKFLSGAPLPGEEITIVFLLQLLAVLLSIGLFFWQMLRAIWSFGLNIYINRVMVRDMDYLTEAETRKAIRHYIPSRGQLVAASEHKETNSNLLFSNKQKLIPFFTKKGFKDGGDDIKYYFILADSGMGKSTFLINLYIKYRLKRFLPWHRKFDIQFIPLNIEKPFDKIKAIKKPKSTILLLDAFDEDNEAVKNYKERLEELSQTIEHFREVVITCRTQFFPSNEEEPNQTGLYRLYDNDSGEHLYQKIYLAPFSDKDVTKYLRKSFPLLNPLNWKKYRRAKTIVNKSPNLKVRPMLLSYMTDLLEPIDGQSQQVIPTYDYAFQIYEAIINRWINRERNKKSIQQKYKGKDYASILSDFSSQLAVNLYLKRNDRKGLLQVHFTEEIGKGINLKDIEDNFNLFTQQERRSRTLLNRNAQGYYKFAHKSILEYYLAKAAFKNFDFHQKADFLQYGYHKKNKKNSMDAARNFYKEMMINQLPKTKKLKKYIEGYLNKSEIVKFDLSEAGLSEADLKGAKLSGAKLIRANLYNVDLRGANLLLSNLRGANLNGADLRGADLRGADFGGADLRGADLREANLNGANLSEADLSRADLRGVTTYKNFLNNNTIIGIKELNQKYKEIPHLQYSNLSIIQLKQPPN